MPMSWQLSVNVDRASLQTGNIMPTARSTTFTRPYGSCINYHYDEKSQPKQSGPLRRAGASNADVGDTASNNVAPCAMAAANSVPKSIKPGGAGAQDTDSKAAQRRGACFTAHVRKVGPARNRR